MMTKLSRTMANINGFSMKRLVKLLALVALLFAGAAGAQRTQPKINGAVYGGGRMADVDGSTLVTVVNCDTIGAVFGGNDIAGSVNATNSCIGSGFAGTEVVIGNASTDAAIKIGSVYGGGNGYYAYNGTSFTAASGSYSSQSVAAAGTVKAMSKDYSVGNAVWTNGGTDPVTLSFPTTPRTKVTITNDYASIDTLFGGAKNAFITATEGNSTLLNINGGSIYSVFGGNNVGGTLGTGSTHTINVSSTSTYSDLSLTSNQSVNLGGNSEYGTNYAACNAHGIRYLFGGGNKANAQTVHINITGGQIDTVYAGGNSASVAATTVDVNVTSSLNGTYAATGYNENNSIYDVRCLFGGNNAAAMAVIPTLNLTKGYVHTVYGGGNAGEMTGSETYTDNTGNASATRSTKVLLNSSDFRCDTVYGGGQSAGTTHDTYVEVDKTSGTALTLNVGTIFGGTNISGNVVNTAKSNVLIADGTVNLNVFGGSNGYYRCNNESVYGATYPADANYSRVAEGVDIPHIWHTNVKVTGGNLLGNVYGGGNLAPVSNNGHSTKATVKVDISGGTFAGNVFAGGNYANVYGTADLFISDSPVMNGDIYGGNDRNGTVTGAGRTGTSTALVPDVTVASTGLSRAIYPESMVQNSTVALTQNNAATYVKITGTPDINGTVYGGGNGYYDYNGSTSTPAPDIYSCSNDVPAQFSSFVDLNMNAAGDINRVFAGGNSANNGVAGLMGIAGTPKVTVYVNNAHPDAHVGTLFGGNNMVAMDVVPNLLLMQGTIGTIYGGGNQGAMAGTSNVRGKSVSTYVGIASPQMTVTDIYGGCNVADVTNRTYVYIEDGAVNGNVFGGNDIAGTVGTESFVVVNGVAGMSLDGSIFGGGNGNYDYNVADGHYSVTKDGVTYTGLEGRPYVASTIDSIIGNNAYTLNGIIYGGGLAGDCNNTRVVVNAPNATITNMIFGGGKGDVDHIGDCSTSYSGYWDNTNNQPVAVLPKHVGNVNGTANLELRSMGSFTGGKIYGGGHNGDVNNTELTVYPTLIHTIQEIYGGCLASDVTGTAHTLVDGYMPPSEEQYTINTIYGGNDFSGRVENTNLEINSGRFYYVYGAGNGDYDYRGTLSNAVESSEYIHELADGKYWKFTCPDTVPYSMNIEVTINDGEYVNNVYGGGNMGLVGDRDMLASTMTNLSNDDRNDAIGLIVLNIHGGNFNRHVYGGARGRTTTEMPGKGYFGLKASTHAHTNAGHNVLDSVMGRQLAYATKIVNMDGGYINFSLHGGSEAVDDGFTYECVDDNLTTPKTTLRPSSIVNLVGGTVRKSLYGGGYQGNIYGSVYVNIGIQAVYDSPVWTNEYGVAGHTVTFGAYKPNLLDQEEARVNNSDLRLNQANPISLGASVYAASDWGEAGANSYFFTRGVFGGVTEVLVDGAGYNTSLSNTSLVNLPQMNINYSIIGAGTSTTGGDVNSLITLRRYGDYECPDPSKTLYSIQRADKVILDSAFIHLKGDQDAFTSFVSPSYTFCRIDTLIFRYDNVVVIDEPAIWIGNVVSLESRDKNATYHFADDGTLQLTDGTTAPAHTLLQNTYWTANTDGQFRTYPEGTDSRVARNFYTNMFGTPEEGAPCNNSSCDDVGVCEKAPTMRGEPSRIGNFNVLMMRNGSYVKVYPFEDDDENGVDEGNHGFGNVYGYMYLIAQDNTKSYVYADYKNNTTNQTQGGFLSPCYCNNVADVVTPTNGNELPYTNVDLGVDIPYPYRSWTVGTELGKRTRHIALVANAVPDGRLNFPLTQQAYDKVSVNATGDITTTTNGSDLTGSSYENLAYATASLELPPADGGHFYLIHSVVIDQDNGGQMTLVDEAYFNNKQADANHDEGVFTFASPINTIASIKEDPNYTFGLTFSSVGNNNFSTSSDWNAGSPLCQVTQPVVRHLKKIVSADGSTCSDPYVTWPRSIVSGSQYLTNQGGYISSAVTNGVGVIPVINFTLTYSTNLTQTVMRNVQFTMYEYDAQGNYIGPIDVTVTISTVIRDFDDIPVPTLAMYNDGLYNEYIRKASIPASFKQRHLYLKDIEWYPNDDPVTRGQIRNDVNGVRFQLQDSESPILDNNHFSVVVRPTESSSDNVNNSLGWYNIEDEMRNMDIYKMALDEWHTTHPGVDFTSSVSADVENPVGVFNQNSIYNSATEYPKTTTEQMIYVGTLDGRASASMEVQLNFDGLMVYDEHYTEPVDPFAVRQGPLGWVDLTFYWENTQDVRVTDASHGEFKMRIKIRTRKSGDTIYVAPGPSLTRTPLGASPGNVSTSIHEGSPTQNDNGFTIGDDGSITLYSYESKQDNPNEPYTNLLAQRADIVDHPNNYLQSLKAAMMIYHEGDVISVMETMPIESATNPISIIGDDYSIIQMIRYSGNHALFPTLACANTHALLDIKGDGFLTMRNVRINGSGCTRTKQATRQWNPSLPANAGKVGRTDYLKIGDNDYYYFENEREEILLASKWPMVYTHENGSVNFSSNVIQTNNFNNYDNATGTVGTDGMMGGAMALCKDVASQEPTIILGDLCTIGDNLVVDWNQATRDESSFGTSDMLPHNYGGAVYVNGGTLVLGTGTDQAKLDIARNYYLDRDVSTSLAGVTSKTMKLLEGTNYDFDVYYLDTVGKSEHYALSNIYLTRLTTSDDATDATHARPATDFPVRLDHQNDVVHFISELTPESRVGISKWFPGYVYDNPNAHERMSCPNPRDTIAFATLGSGKSDATLVDKVFHNNVFFNDSAYYTEVGGSTAIHEDPADPSSAIVGYTPAFKNMYPGVKYNRESEVGDTLQGFNDNVYIFSNQLVNPYTIYFQRCASFRKGIMRDDPIAVMNNGHEVYIMTFRNVDSIGYHWNPRASCVSSTDSLFFRVGGGFFPYTYTWVNHSDTLWTTDGGITSTTERPSSATRSNIYSVQNDTIRQRLTYGSNYITNYAVPEYAALRRQANRDTFLLRDLYAEEGTYAFEASAVDATGNCHLSMPVRVRVNKVVNIDYNKDDDNFLRNDDNTSDENYYLVHAPGVDSSSFHDRDGRITEPPTGSIARKTYDQLAAVVEPINHTLEPHYLRTYTSYYVKPNIMPTTARGTIGVWREDHSAEHYDVDASDMNDPDFEPPVSFCPGDIVQLKPKPLKAAAGSGEAEWQYMAWDHNPTAPDTTSFVVTNRIEENSPTVYYSRGDYWYEHVTSKPAGYQELYNNDVIISSKEGLAWLISTVNGYNGCNAQTFRFNTITIKMDDGKDYDMQAHKWTPLGNNINHFEGTIVVDNSHNTTNNSIKNIIVNELNVPMVGMFGYTHEAHISGLVLEDVAIKGPQYVAALAGKAFHNTEIKDVTIKDGIVFGEYCTGGLVSWGSNTTIEDCRIGGTIEATPGMTSPELTVTGNALSMVGGAIYAGGVCAYAYNVDGSDIAAGIDATYLNALFAAAGINNFNVETPGTKGKRKDQSHSTLRNSYFNFRTGSQNMRVGGLAGTVDNIDIENCYVYGELKYMGYGGGLVGYLGQNVNINNCYYVDGLDNSATGYNSTGVPLTKSTTFHGSGNQVLLTERVDGYSNMTRALNKWVQAQNDTTLNRWRSDLDNVNNGYPIFGDPDMIPVFDTLQTASCEEYDFDGLLFYESGNYVFHVVDSADYLDSTFTLMLTINHGDSTAVSDTVAWGDAYEGYGFSFTANDLMMSSNAVRNSDVYALHFVDSLFTVNGCDSVVTLTLYVMRSGVDVPEVMQQLSDVKVYPNPTRGVVHVEGSGLQRVETYDASGKKLGEKAGDAADNSIITLDLHGQASGAYYLRVQTTHGTVVKKVIKK